MYYYEGNTAPAFCNTLSILELLENIAKHRLFSIVSMTLFDSYSSSFKASPVFKPQRQTNHFAFLLLCESRKNKKQLWHIYIYLFKKM